jgi:hypothetical protein
MLGDVSWTSVGQGVIAVGQPIVCLRGPQVAIPGPLERLLGVLPREGQRILGSRHVLRRRRSTRSSGEFDAAGGQLL